MALLKKQGRLEREVCLKAERWTRREEEQQQQQRWLAARDAAQQQRQEQLEAAARGEHIAQFGAIARRAVKLGEKLKREFEDGEFQEAQGALHGAERSAHVSRIIEVLDGIHAAAFELKTGEPAPWDAATRVGRVEFGDFSEYRPSTGDRM